MKSIPVPSGTADPDAPLWRAAQVFRLVTVVYAVSSHFSTVQNYTDEALSWFLIGVLVVWSLTSALLLSRGSRERPVVVVVDQITAIALMASTRLISDHDWYSHHQTMPTTLWVANAVISAALFAGPLAGIASALVMAAVSAVVRDQVNLDLWSDATAPVLVACGVAMGFAMRTARTAHRQLEDAVRIAAATEERDRLARQVHDGVLQVLALVQRRADEDSGLGVDRVELARLAGEQEEALRRLISEQDTEVDRGGQHVDLTAMLRMRVDGDVTVAAPADPVVMDRTRAGELVALATTALDNVEHHAGPDARAFVLLEDLGDEIVLSVRDDGIGIEAGRLAAASAQGRLGVSKSIVGRARWLGGVAELETAPGEGTEWEIRVPKEEPHG
ncbi:MacS family sensor histidine kinase [Rhodococcus sp. NPDC060086]|uniref:MacS family sensor histidine kinase n=1 Tax=Rhodococcus sp. NPDC060086 TaxID=3347055 RepID=UPI00364F993F